MERLVPAGDTATSRRLFDAMGAGCEPVYLGRMESTAVGMGAQTIGQIDPDSGQSNLPFRSLINWSAVVQFEELDCLLANDHEGARSLARRLSSFDDPAAFVRGCRTPRHG